MEDASREWLPDPPPRVAVITATYNRAHVLPRAIESVLTQDYPSFRLVVVDDGSTDDTPALLRRYQADARVEVVRHKTNRGVLAARNSGLDRLTAEDTYYCYLDSDDTLVPGAIRTMVRPFVEHGDRYSMIWAESQNAQTGRFDGRRSLSSSEITFDDQLAGRMVGDHMQLVRRDLAEGLRHEPEAITDEAVIWAQILRTKPALMIDDVVQLTDQSGADRLSIGRYDRAYSEARMWSRLVTLRVLGADMRRAYPQRYAAQIRELARDATLAGDRRRARLASRQAMRLDPTLRSFLIACAALAPTWVVRRSAHAASFVRNRRWRRGRPSPRS